MKKLILLGIIAIAAVIFFAARQEKPKTPPETSGGPPARPSAVTPPPAEQTLTAPSVITYSDDGYSPSSINIKIGEIITFINQSQDPMWPASDVHPIHSIYPEFDPKKSFGSGEEYRFKFEKAGTWQYHDHLRPAKKGTVTVK